MKKMERLKRKYEEIEIPTELEDVVNASIQEAKRKKNSTIQYWMLSIVAAASLFIGSINMSPKIAQAMMNIPVLGSIVEVLTAHQFTVNEETYQAELNTPEIQGLKNKELQTTLNEKYLEENQMLFQQFKQEMTEMKQNGNGHLGINTIYEVKTDTAQIFSIARYEVHTNASSSTTLKYDTIDKEREILITLPSLFKDDRYIEVISTYITNEMQRQMDEDQATSYFLNEEFAGDFKTIKPDQNFYITADHKLVISFDQYEVAPGYMGVVKFTIPSELLTSLLVNDIYIH